MATMSTIVTTAILASMVIIITTVITVTKAIIAITALMTPIAITNYSDYTKTVTTAIIDLWSFILFLQSL